MKTEATATRREFITNQIGLGLTNAEILAAAKKAGIKTTLQPIYQARFEIKKKTGGTDLRVGRTKSAPSEKLDFAGILAQADKVFADVRPSARGTKQEQMIMIAKALQIFNKHANPSTDLATWGPTVVSEWENLGVFGAGKIDGSKASNFFQRVKNMKSRLAYLIEDVKKNGQ